MKESGLELCVSISFGKINKLYDSAPFRTTALNVSQSNPRSCFRSSWTRTPFQERSVPTDPSINLHAVQSLYFNPFSRPTPPTLFSSAFRVDAHRKRALENPGASRPATLKSERGKINTVESGGRTKTNKH